VTIGERLDDTMGANGAPDPGGRLRCRVAEPDLDFREFCRRDKLPSPSAPGTCSLVNATGRGETDFSFCEVYNPFHHHQQGPSAWSLPLPAMFSELDGRTSFLAPLLPVPGFGRGPVVPEDGGRAGVRPESG
jgi:hypothetical protein